MPRYMVERVFPQGLSIPANPEGARACSAVQDKNSKRGVHWVQSYVSGDGRKTFCLYDAPSPEAVRRAAQDSDLPVERITEVRVLDPYFHH